ncbi:MAG: AAA family ATPase [Planctomycetota bacterium]|jgi:MoxR-like ATPase
MTDSKLAPEAQVARCAEVAQILRQRLSERIVGHDEVLDLVLTGLFAGGHGLLEGVPGIGKTLLVRSVAEAIDASFARIQFTPDLMPADVTGTMVLYESSEGGREFRFREGPVFAHVLLADEINRATPKTQAAMLEAMEERQVTADGKARMLPVPFFVLATQNPLEMEGTYPLPEAQLDRFLYKILVPRPSSGELVSIIELASKQAPASKAPVTNAAEISAQIALARDVVLTEEIRALIAKLVLATHPDGQDAPEKVRRFIRHGASPRAALAIAMGLKARALMLGRAHAERSDIPVLFKPALRHRIALNFEGEAEGLTTDDILDEVLGAYPVRA